MIALTPTGKPLFAGGNFLKLGPDSAPSDPPDTPGGPMPTDSLAGWWDVSALGAGSVSSISDSSIAGKNASTDASVVPRQAGLLAGLYKNAFPFNYTVLHPVIVDYSVTASNIAVGTGQAFTVFLVWSRPNQRQPDMGALSTADVPLISIGGVSVLSLTAAGDGSDALKLFPAGSPVTGGVLALRHTHSARLVFNGSTVDVWLDDAKVITGATNQITLGATANLAFLNAAQCIFHEAAAWNVALTTDKHAELTSYATRWPLGPRRAANGIIIGQSNADNLFGSFVVWPTFNKHLAYWTGCISANLLRGGGTIAGGATIYSGQGLYDTSGNLFLNSSSGAANVAAWPLGANGNSFMTAIDSMTADQVANLRFIAWYWSESDSASLTYANKATYFGAMKRAFSLIRTQVGMTPAQLPILVINALPFTTDVGCQTHREVMADLVADDTLNVRFMLAQSDDATGQGDSWDAATGVESGGGNTAHRDATGATLFLRRWSMPIARAVIAANAASSTTDAVTAIDESVPVTGGPSITAATYEGTTYEVTGTVLVTVAHDGGDDLIVPLRAAMGVGWTLMDGVSDSVAGTPGAPGALIQAIACERVSTTQLRVTLASLPSHPTMAQLYYVYGTGLDASGYAIVGRGNAVTDNFNSITLAAGWRISDYDASAQPNNPLHATTYGIALS